MPSWHPAQGQHGCDATEDEQTLTADNTRQQCGGAGGGSDPARGQRVGPRVGTGMPTGPSTYQCRQHRPRDCTVLRVGASIGICLSPHSP